MNHTERPKVLSPGQSLLIGAAALFCMATAAVGCSAEEATSERERIIARFEKAGIRASDLEFEGDNVRVQGDVIITRKQLEAAMASTGTPGADGGAGLSPKGYAYGTILGQPRPPVDKLSFHFDANVPEKIRTALRQAAAEWDSSAVCVRMVKEDSLYPAKIAFGPDPTNHAASTSPHYLEEGRIYFNSDWVQGTGIFAGAGPASEASLYHTALHEMGHLIGIAHPSQYNHVPGTATTGPTCGSNGGGCLASYPTVMDYDTKVEDEEPHLTPDDRATADELQKPLFVGGFCPPCFPWFCPSCIGCR
jgi:hypothetical protein